MQGLLGMARPSGKSTVSRQRRTLSWGRLARILLGYLAGSAAAALAVPAALALHDLVTLGTDRMVRKASLADWLIIAGFSFAIVVVVAAPFAVAFILAAESGGVRHPLAHMAFGALTGLIVTALLVALGLVAGGTLGLSGPIAFSAVGAIGGLVYWLVAGRSGGGRSGTA